MDEGMAPEPLSLNDLEVGMAIQVRDVHGHVIYDGEVMRFTTGGNPMVTFRDIDEQKCTKGAAEMGLVPYIGNCWCGQRRTYLRSDLPPEAFPPPENSIPGAMASVSA